MSILLMILKFLPSVLAAIKGVEDVIGAGNGATKKQLVLNSISSVAAIGEKVDDKNVQAISALIDSTVTTLNSSGIFKKTT